MDAILEKDKILEGMEQNLQWGETLSYCETQLRLDANCKKLLRLMSQAWFLCAYADELPPYDANPYAGRPPEVGYNRVLDILSKTLKYGDANFYSNSSYLSLTGTLMILHPEFFLGAIETSWFEDVTNAGIARLTRAYRNDAVMGHIFFGKKRRQGFLREQEGRVFIEDGLFGKRERKAIIIEADELDKIDRLFSEEIAKVGVEEISQLFPGDSEADFFFKDTLEYYMKA